MNFPLSMFLYIGPGMGAGALILMILILTLVAASFGYLIWYRLKRALKKKK